MTVMPVVVMFVKVTPMFPLPTSTPLPSTLISFTTGGDGKSAKFTPVAATKFMVLSV